MQGVPGVIAAYPYHSLHLSSKQSSSFLHWISIWQTIYGPICSNHIFLTAKLDPETNGDPNKE